MEFADLAHHVDEYAPGPTEGEETGYGDHRTDQAPPIGECDTAFPQRGVCLEYEVIGVPKVRNYSEPPDRNGPDQRLKQMDQSKQRDGRAHQHVDPPVRRARRVQREADREQCRHSVEEPAMHDDDQNENQQGEAEFGKWIGIAETGSYRIDSLSDRARLVLGKEVQ